MGVYITHWKSETELKGASLADVQNGTYFGGPWGPLMQFLTIYSGCHSLAGKFLHWGKCQCDPRVSECRCCDPESPWCWCARHPRTEHRLERGCSGCLRVQMWDQQDPDLEQGEKWKEFVVHSFPFSIYSSVESLNFRTVWSQDGRILVVSCLSTQNNYPKLVREITKPDKFHSDKWRLVPPTLY